MYIKKHHGLLLAFVLLLCLMLTFAACKESKKGKQPVDTTAADTTAADTTASDPTASDPTASDPTASDPTASRPEDTTTEPEETTTDTEVTTAHVCSFGAWNETKPATCTEGGISVRECACGNSETKTTPSTGHTEGSWIVDTEAQPGVNGSKHVECTVCHETLKTEFIPALPVETSPDHTCSFGAWNVAQAATCTGGGIRVRRCSCGNIESQAIPAKGHTESDWIVDTEAQPGVNGSKHVECTVCHTTLKTEVIPARPVVTEPEVTTTEPEVTTTEPEVTTTEPEVTTTEPEVTTTEPEDTTSSEPETTTSEPETTVPAPAEDFSVNISALAGGQANWTEAFYETPVVLLNYNDVINLGYMDLSGYAKVRIQYGCDGNSDITGPRFAALNGNVPIGLKSTATSYGNSGNYVMGGDVAHTDMTFSTKAWGTGARWAEIDLTNVNYAGNVYVALHNPEGTMVAISGIQFIASGSTAEEETTTSPESTTEEPTTPTEPEEESTAPAVLETMNASASTSFKYLGHVDWINGVQYDLNGYRNNGVSPKVANPAVLSGIVASKAGKLTITGWALVNGGQDKYFWSVDGQNWYEFAGGSYSATGQAHADHAKGYAGADVTSVEPANGIFDNITADLSAYRGKTITVYIAVRSLVPAGTPAVQKLCHFLTLKDLAVPNDNGEVEQTLKVISFNVQTENGTSVDMNTRAELLKALINQKMPDSIGMQEVTAAWRSKMDSYVFDPNIYAGVGVARTTDASLGLEQCAIFYRKDKYILVDSGTFWLSDTPDVVGSMYADAIYPRICTWVRLKDRVTGFEYVHLNTHLHHKANTEGNNIRKAQIKVLLDFVQSLGDLPMVMTGDFNQKRITSDGTTPYALYQYITGDRSFTNAAGQKVTANFADARIDAAKTVSSSQWASLTKNQDPTNTDNYDPSAQPIDYIFYTDAYLTAKVYENIHYKPNGIYMSDHLPQYAELTYTVQLAN